MLQSTILTAIRNLYRNRTFTLINLTGISVGMSLALLIIMVIREQYTFDNFHQDSDRIFRVNTMAVRTDGQREPYASAPLPVASTISSEYTFASKVVRLNRQLRADATFGDVNVPIRGLFTDPSFLEVFNFPLEKGDSRTVLSQPNGLVLTMPAAEKIFGQRDPIGKTVTLSGYGEFTVTGVLKPFLSRTHFEFEVLASTSALPLFEKEGKVMSSIDDWNNYYSGYVYFKLAEGHSTDEAEKALARMSKEKYANLKLETRDAGYAFYLHPLAAITPGPELSNQMGNGMPTMVIIFLGVLASLVMLMACFNYTNLTIAKSLSRAREIGVRKIIGAGRMQVFGQFIGEAVVFSLLALVVSYFLLQILKPAFVQLNIAREFSADLTEDFSLYLYFIAFAILTGMLAGVLPAGYLSSLKPLGALKSTGSAKPARLIFRKSLIVIQFTLSLVFIIFVVIVYNQVDYMVNKDYGFDDKHILNVRLQGMPFEKFASEAARIPGVESVGGVSHALGTWEDNADDFRRNKADDAMVVRQFLVDDHYITNLKLEFAAGRGFEPGMQGHSAVINERALKTFGFASASDAVGETIYVGDSTQLLLVGVVKDFNFRPLSYAIGPLVFRYDLESIGLASLRVEPQHTEAVTAAVRKLWKELDPIHPAEVRWMEAQIDDAYTDSGFKDIIKVVGYISFLAITLACLGMLGMAMYATQTRIKEIGIRKVMGGSSRQITILLSRSFLVLIGVAVVLGTPAGYWLGNLFLDNYAYRITISGWLILQGILLISGLAVITIASQTWKAAASDPVEALKCE